jgi:hypothetical protein
MSPKNTARNAGLWPYGMASIRAVARGGFAEPAITRLVGAIRQPVADGRWHGSVDGL